MECNKDEAARAKEIAERKLLERNYLGAKKFVVKATNLYPDLEGLAQMSSTLDVYISAESKIAGESDWYGVLGVSPLADDDLIRKQYRRLALALHPDKNKAVGAEGAFKLVSEAWGLLSDKNKRLSYNEKRNSGFVGFPTRPAPAPAPAPATQQKKSSAPKPPARPKNNNAGRAGIAVAAKKAGGDTFWTICKQCKTHYEYMRIYLNHTLLCPNCHEAFVAQERAPPANVFKQANWTSRKPPPPPPVTAPPPPPPQPQPPAPAAAPPPPQSGCSTNFQWDPFSQAAQVVQQASEKVIKRQREEFERTQKLFADRPTKKTNNAENNNHHHHVNGFYYTATNGNSNPVSEPNRVFVKPNTVRELSFPELKNILIHKAKNKIVKMLRDWKENRNKNEIVSSKKQKRVAEKAESQSVSVDDANVSMNVPDSDFHNFDSDRTGDSFKEDQVWAAFDDDDGMPRFYARVHKVVSTDPFRIRISWLNSRTNTELGPLDWIGRGFAKTCGEFRPGKHESSGSLNSFSHRVAWDKGPRGSVRIYPRKGEVWALYKNWSKDWDEKTPDEVIHKYEMVEVVEDFDEERGTVSVALLHKVPGFRTVFRSDPKKEEAGRVRRTFPKEEMFRLSHQVPYHVLSGQEAENAPKGCLELDPAATPLELIQAENGNNGN